MEKIKGDKYILIRNGIEDEDHLKEGQLIYYATEKDDCYLVYDKYPIFLNDDLEFNYATKFTIQFPHIFVEEFEPLISVDAIRYQYLQ